MALPVLAPILITLGVRVGLSLASHVVDGVVSAVSRIGGGARPTPSAGRSFASVLEGRGGPAPANAGAPGVRTLAEAAVAGGGASPDGMGQFVSASRLQALAMGADAGKTLPSPARAAAAYRRSGTPAV
jgi:hypothetical protein